MGKSMKKKNLIFSFLLALVACTLFGFTNNLSVHSAFAAGAVEITFETDGGICEISTATTKDDGTLDSLPEATKEGYVFAGWKNGTELVTTDTVFSENTTIYATWERKLNNYLISKTGESYTLTGRTTNSSLPYTLTASSLANALEVISADLVSTNSPVTLNFDNITLDEDLSLSLENITLSGTLNINEFSVYFTAPKNSSILTLESLTLNATSNQNQLIIDGDLLTDLVVSNTNFNTSNSASSYAIKFNTPKHSVTIKNLITHQTEYFYNHEIGLAVTFDDTFSLENQPSGKVSITIPYAADGQSILNTKVTNTSLFNLIPNQNNFTCSINLLNGTSLIVKTQFDINFNPNGGTIADDYEKPNFSFRITAETLYPTAEDLTKTHCSLGGFAGKLNLSAEFMAKYSLSNSVLYFDKTMLSNFIQNGANFADLETYFSLQIPESQNGFTYYEFDSTGEDLNYQAIKIMLDLNQTPEFVALWTETVYTISFDENGGESVSQISAKFDESVTLSITTKTGFDFDGWYLDESLETKANITTMPDTNPTLYAKWIVHSHLLTIYQNNGTSKIEKPIDFGTLFSSISELQVENFSKIGYTFNGWFTDESLSQELALSSMPDNNLVLYAKWNINTYTITLFYNHKSNDGIYKSLTQEFGTDISSLKAETPAFEGFTFLGWFTDKNGQFAYTIPNTMPANSETDGVLKIYAFFIPTEYKITFYYKTSVYWTIRDMHFGDTIELPANPSISGLIFDNWYNDASFTEPFSFTTMPSRDLSVYAKMIDKKTITLNEKQQTYNISGNPNFALSFQLNGFKVEYLVDGNWTITAPTKKGTYDVRITRNEDSEYKAFSSTITGGLKIIADNIDINIYSLILYCLAGIELICAIIVLFLRKQRKTYLTYAIVLPFGVISNSQFINFLVALTLAVFGFVLLIIQIVKLKQVNTEIARISTEEHGYKPPDVSENKSISKNVEIILEKEGFTSAHDEDFNLDNLNEPNQEENEINSNGKNSIAGTENSPDRFDDKN